VFSEEVTFHLFLLLVLTANHIATPFDLRALFLRLLQDADSLCEGGPLRIQPFQSIMGASTID
jgi:hypothetical protein